MGTTSLGISSLPGVASSISGSCVGVSPALLTSVATVSVPRAMDDFSSISIPDEEGTSLASYISLVQTAVRRLPSLLDILPSSQTPFFMGFTADNPLAVLYDTGSFSSSPHTPPVALISHVAATRTELPILPSPHSRIGGVGGHSGIAGELRNLQLDVYLQSIGDLPVHHSLILPRVIVLHQLAHPEIDLLLPPALSWSCRPIHEACKRMQDRGHHVIFLKDKPTAGSFLEGSTSSVNPIPENDADSLSTPYALAASANHFAFVSSLVTMDETEIDLDFHRRDVDDAVDAMRDKEAQDSAFAEVLADPSCPPELKEVLPLYADVFGPLSTCNYKDGVARLQLKDTATTWKDRPQHRFNESTRRDFFVKEIKRFLSDKIVRRVPDSELKGRDPQEFTSVILIVHSKGKLRWVQDLRLLNKHSQVFPCELPTSTDLLRATRGARFFSKIDLLKAFLQIPLSKESQQFFSFFVPHSYRDEGVEGGRYEYLRMPLGWVNATYCFQQIMQSLLGDLISNGHVLVYLDDVLLLSKTREQHLWIIKQVLQRLQNAGLRASISKCAFLKSSISFLGMKVDGDSISALPENIEALRLLPAPTKLRELQCLLGMFNYYRLHIKDYARIAAPLYELTAPGTRVREVWKEKHNLALQQLKDALHSSTRVFVRQPTGRLTVRTDASDIGYGAVVLQEQGGVDVPLAFFSKVAPRHGKSVGEQEMLAMAYAVDKAKNLLLGAPIRWQCDHRNLCAIDHKSPIIQSVALDLCEYDLTFEHIEGASNYDADTLSRLPPTPLVWPRYPHTSIHAFVGIVPPVRLDIPNPRSIVSAPDMYAFNCTINPPSSSASATSSRPSRTAAIKAKKALSSDLDDLLEATLFETLQDHDRALCGGLSRPPQSTTVPSNVSRNSSSNSVSNSSSSSRSSVNTITATPSASVDMLSPHLSSGAFSSSPTASVATDSLPASSLPSTEEAWVASGRTAEQRVKYLNALQALRLGSARRCTPLLSAILDAQDTFMEDLDTSHSDWSSVPVLDKSILRSLHLFRHRVYVPAKASHVHNLVFDLIHDQSSHTNASGRTLAIAVDAHGLYWPTLNKDAEAYISSCYKCVHSHDNVSKKVSHPLHSRPPPERPHQRIIADLLGPLPAEATDGSTYILFIVDALTRFAYAYPIAPSTGGAPTSQEVIDCLTRHICFCGVPVVLQTDGDKKLCSIACAIFQEKAGYEHHVTTPRHPQSNGLVEVINRIFTVAARSRTGSRVETWETFLHEIMRDINNRYHRVLRMSPYQALYGFPQRTTLASLIDGAFLTGSPLHEDAEFHEAIDEYHKTLNLVVFEARKRTEEEQKRRAANLALALPAHPTSFDANSFVLYNVNSTPGKLLTHFSAIPYQIISREDNDIYRIRSLIAPDVLLRAHASQLKSLPTGRVSAHEQLEIALEKGENLVERIDSHKRDSSGSLRFLVTWLGHPLATWEPADNLRATTEFKEYCKRNSITKAHLRSSSGKA